MQKTQWRSRTSCRKYWWFDCSRSQSSQWRMWIAKQSSICSRGAGLMDPVVSVQNKNFSGNAKGALQKFLEPNWKPKVIHTDNSLEFGNACWRSFLESLYVDTTQIGNKWDCRESSAQSESRHLCCIVAIRSEWKLVGRFHGSVTAICETFKISFLMGRHHTEGRFGEPFNGPIIPFGSLVECYLSAKDQSRIHQFGKKVFPGLFLGYALYAWRISEGWRTGCRPWGVGDDGRIWNLLEKTQCKVSNISQRKRRIYFSNRKWTN